MIERINPYAKYVKSAEELEKMDAIRRGDLVPDEVIDPYLRKINQEKVKKAKKGNKGSKFLK